MTGQDLQTTVDHAALAASMVRLRSRDDRLDLLASLRHVLDSCTQLFQVDGSGLMIADDQGALRYAVATDGPGQLLEEVQLQAGQGPCVDTFANARVTRCRDVAADPRYPKLAEPMRGSRVSAVLGIPVELSGTMVGSLDVYRGDPVDWQPADVDTFVQYGMWSRP